MKWQLHDRSTRLRWISLAVLIAGLVVSAVIYWNAGTDAAEYQLDVTKQYLRQLEVYGGKANVIATDFREWISGLWHGKSLALTVAVLSALVAAGFRLAAIPVPPAGPRVSPGQDPSRSLPARQVDHQAQDVGGDDEA
jgi:hypothetical protein